MAIEATWTAVSIGAGDLLVAHRVDNSCRDQWHARVLSSGERIADVLRCYFAPALSLSSFNVNMKLISDCGLWHARHSACEGTGGDGSAVLAGLNAA